MSSSAEPEPASAPPQEQARPARRWTPAWTGLAGLLRRMLHWPVRSTRQRLLFALLLPMGLVTVSTIPSDFNLAVQPSAQAYDESLAIEAHALAEDVKLAAGKASFELNEQAEAMLRANAGDAEFFALFDADGRRLGGDAFLPRLTPPEDDAPHFSNVQLRLPDRAELLPVRMVSLRHVLGDSEIVVQVAETLGRRKAAERRVLVAMVLPNLLVALIGGLLLYAATRLTVAPLEQLARQVGQRSPDDLAPIALPDAPSEIDAVVAELNRLFARVQGAALTQQRFHANVAHQLRTPLTGLRTQIELAAMDGGFDSDPPRQQRITDALDRLSRLIDQLLTLARAEAGVTDGGRMVPVDLAQLVEKCASELVDQAVAARIDLGFQLDPTPLVSGMPVLLGELLRNLVDNSLRHCPPGSNVTVACGSRAGNAWIAVEDDGPGIAPDQRSEIFVRFLRGRSTSAEGSGLGLAIVKEIAQLHGAEIEVHTPSNGKGVRFELAWKPAQG